MKNESKRSVVIGSGLTRRQTSVFVPAETWEQLKSIAEARGLNRTELIREIDAARFTMGSTENLSDVLRKYVMVRGARKALKARLAGEHAT